MKTSCFIALLAFLCLSGCSTPGSAYARAHPELSAAHREILMNGKVPGGLAVEGMSKEQVRLAAGSPARVEKLEGGEAWVYVHETGFADDAGGQNNSGSRPSPGDPGVRQFMVEKTTVLFQGDRATQTQISHERE